MSMHECLIAFLEANQVQYRKVTHEALGKSEEIAKIRGNELDHSAKAMLLSAKVKSQEAPKHYLVVLPGNCQFDSKALKKDLKGDGVQSLSIESNVTGLTGCVTGAVPPFSLWPGISLLVDSRLATLPQADEIVFNAAELTSSLFISVKDYLRAANPRVLSFAIDKKPSVLEAPHHAMFQPNEADIERVVEQSIPQQH